MTSLFIKKFETIGVNFLRVNKITGVLTLLWMVFMPGKTTVFAQTHKIDSLLSILQTSSSELHDTNRINILNALSRELFNRGNYEKSIQYARNAISVSENSKLSEKFSVKKEKGNAYNILGLIQWRIGNYPEAFKNHFTSLKIREEIGDKRGISASYGNLGNLYQSQNNYTEALKNYFSQLRIGQELNDKMIIANAYQNIGNVYQQQKNNSEALNNFFSSLKIYEEIGFLEGIAGSNNNIGIVYKSMGNYKDALKAYSVCLKIMKEIGNKEGIAMSYINCGELNILLKNFEEARWCFNQSLLLAKEIGSKDNLQLSYYGLSDLNSILGNWESAYEYHKLYSEIKDSIFNEKSSRQIAEMQTKYETEKKEQQIALLNKDKEIQAAAISRQKTIIWFVVGSFLLVVLFSAFIVKERRKSEKLLLNILPSEIARELKIKGKATARHYDSVTVMFTDFKGFTQIAERLTAEELVSELDFIFRKFDEIISRYNIEKIKTIGDAYMCVSGLPVPNKEHAENIVKAALDIQQWMKENHNGRWNIRIGIHSGPVTAGVVGDKKFAYDIWGDTVNTASRMESSGEPGKVNISGVTYKLLCHSGRSEASALRFEYRGRIPAKNKGDIEMYFVEKTAFSNI